MRGGTKPAEEKKKSQPKAPELDSGGVCNADRFRYGDISDFKAQICAIPCKGGRNSRLDKEERESGTRTAVQYVLHLLSLGAGMEIAMV